MIVSRLILLYVPKEFAESLPGVNSRSPYPNRRRKCHSRVSFPRLVPAACSSPRSDRASTFAGPGSAASANKCSTLPAHLSHRLSVERPDRPGSSREGYYSDRNELARERDRERGYLSDHNSR